MVSGRDTLASIERAIDDVQRSETSVQKSLEEANQKRVKLNKKRTEVLRNLAELRVKHALADGIIDSADRLAHQVKTLLKAREKTVASIKTRLETIEKNRQENLHACEEIGAEITKLEARLDELAQQAERELMDNADYVVMRDKLDRAQAVYEKAKEKTEQAEEDRERKGRAYQNDPLFMYLWRCKYGSSNYKPNGLIRWLDEKIAKLVGYNEARANYAVLLEIPVRLGDHLKHLGRRRDEEQSKLDAAKADKIKQLAGRDLYDDLRQARKTEKERHEDREHLGAELAEITSQMNLYAEGRDHAFKKAIEITVDFVEQDDLIELMRDARETEDPRDDEVTQILRATDKDIEQLRDSIDDKREELERLFKRKQELIQIAADFRRSHYDDPGSVFEDGSNLGIFLEELLRGAITGADYWSRAQRRHRWRSRPADPFRRRSPFPPLGGSMGRGSRSSQPDFSTGGGF